MISKGDWEAWKANGVTKAFFAAMIERIEDCKNDLGTSAGIESDFDNFRRGFIHAYREALNFDIDFEESHED